jgi:tetratricopeptide (TPR) repeat protein
MNRPPLALACAAFNLLLWLPGPMGQALAQTRAPMTPLSLPELKEQQYLGLDQLWSIMHASKRQYTVSPLSQLRQIDLAKGFFPAQRNRLKRPLVETAGQDRKVINFRLSRKAARLIKRGDRMLSRRKYAHAIQAYEAALDVQPNCYPALLGLGRLQVARGEPTDGLAFLHRAQVFNPDDPALHRAKAEAALARGQGVQALRHLVQALSRAPRDEAVLGLARREAKSLNVRVARSLFTPRALARSEGRKMAIYMDSADPASRAWTAYAAAKAVWQGEPEVRKRYGGDQPDASWSTEQEFFSINALLGNYTAARQAGTIERLPSVERILAILQQGLLFEFVMYEMASRIDPNLLVAQTPKQRERMIRFIDRFVLVPQR